jgi:phenylalanyl-tRNA synthetase beta chain
MRIRGGVADVRGPVPPTKTIELPVEFVERRLGKNVGRDSICSILASLGFGWQEKAPGVLSVTAPTWRATKDISLRDDLVEEVGRIIGYGEITPAAPLVASVPPPEGPLRLYLRRVRSELAAQGFTEVYNYSFVNDAEVRRFGMTTADHVAVKNPIAAELSHLRRSLLPGIFKNLRDNVRHLPEFRLFEVGSEVHPPSNGDGLPDEAPHVAALLYNGAGDEQDFFELKRVVECLFGGAALKPCAPREYEHPTRTAEIHWRKAVVGRIFEIHPLLLLDEGIGGRAVVFDADLRAAQSVAASATFHYAAPRKYPVSGFDLSVVADLKLPVAEIEEQLRRLAGTDLAAIEFVRQYAGSPLPEGAKSVSYHVDVAASDRTLTTAEVTAVRDRIIEGMQAQGFELRV